MFNLEQNVETLRLRKDRDLSSENVKDRDLPKISRNETFQTKTTFLIRTRVASLPRDEKV